MMAFAVKHIAADMGPLATILKDVKKQPYSLTSKKREALKAASGNFVYVIEVQLINRKTIYRLGYKYRARHAYLTAGRGQWPGGFTYKNTAGYGVDVEGAYFGEPLEIEDVDFVDWFKTNNFGMRELEGKYRDILERIFSEPTNKATSFQIRP